MPREQYPKKSSRPIGSVDLPEFRLNMRVFLRPHAYSCGAQVWHGKLQAARGVFVSLSQGIGACAPQPRAVFQAPVGGKMSQNPIQTDC